MDNTPIESLDKAMKSGQDKATTAITPYTAEKAQILVVDDNSMNLRLMEALLKRTKAKVDFLDRPA